MGSLGTLMDPPSAEGDIIKVQKSTKKTLANSLDRPLFIEALTDINLFYPVGPPPHPTMGKGAPPPPNNGEGGSLVKYFYIYLTLG